MNNGRLIYLCNGELINAVCQSCYGGASSVITGISGQTLPITYRRRCTPFAIARYYARCLSRIDSRWTNDWWYAASLRFEFRYRFGYRVDEFSTWLWRARDSFACAEIRNSEYVVLFVSKDAVNRRNLTIKRVTIGHEFRTELSRRRYSRQVDDKRWLGTFQSMKEENSVTTTVTLSTIFYSWRAGNSALFAFL